ncbi:MAG TPA: hypothetical protein VGY48_02410 [Vicinamibacterales bacterium]|nr:hypothetical protein [Vicinamibacterales bacterium]
MPQVTDGIVNPNERSCIAMKFFRLGDAAERAVSGSASVRRRQAAPPELIFQQVEM